jgi:HPt (histidine-containing phosphotransfer) domain-containing protein
VLEKLLASSEPDLKLFTTTAHGMKSALLNVNEKKLSATALKLEKAGESGEIEFVKTQTPKFINALCELLKQLAPKEENDADGDAEFLKEKLKEIKIACEGFKKRDAKTALGALKKKKWTDEIKVALDEISDCLLCGEFEKAAAAAVKISGD